MPIERIDHVQLAMPPGGEPAAREFYGRLLGLPEVPKPRELQKRGGAWFEKGEVRIHLGVDPDFLPARKAHPGLRVSDLASLVSALRDGGYEPAEDGSVPGARRVFVTDPFGNRLELIESE